MIGTMVLVLMGCGSAVFAGSMAGTVGAGVGTVGVALAFGLSVVAMAYAIGGISGCHIGSFRRPCHRSFSGIGAYRMYPYYRYFRQSGT